MPDSFMSLRGYEEFESDVLLFDLKQDPGQRVNLSEKYPDRVKAMASLLERYRTQGYSVPRS